MIRPSRTLDLFWPVFLATMAVFLWLWIDQMETDRMLDAGDPDAASVTHGEVGR